MTPAVGDDAIPPTIAWHRGAVRVLDQRALPQRTRFLQCRSVDVLCDAIATLAVRGAPALGAAGAYGVALAAHTMRTKRQVRAAAARVAHARPTAVNLAWGVACALNAYERDGAAGALACAQTIATDEARRNRAMGAHGAPLVPIDGAVLTHCNTGALACVEYGTALGVVRAAAEQQRRPRVIVDETRPLLQGARLDDVGVGSARHRRDVDPRWRSRVVDGASRSRHRHRRRRSHRGERRCREQDRYVRSRDCGAPPQRSVLRRGTDDDVDLATATGDDITIEERAPDEVTRVAGVAIAPEGAHARNPAFDVTPARLVTAIVTEVGIARPPYRRSLPAQVRRAVESDRDPAGGRRS